LEQHGIYSAAKTFATVNPDHWHAVRVPVGPFGVVININYSGLKAVANQHRVRIVAQMAPFPGE